MFCGVVAVSCTLCLTAAVLEFRKDPLQQSGARVFGLTGRLYSGHHRQGGALPAVTSEQPPTAS